MLRESGFDLQALPSRAPEQTSSISTKPTKNWNARLSVKGAVRHRKYGMRGGGGGGGLSMRRGEP